MKEIAYIGSSKSWEDVDKSIEMEIETNRANNYLIRDIMNNIGNPVKKINWIDKFKNWISILY